MLRRLISKLGWFKMEINKKNEIDVTENNPIIEKNKVPQPEMKSGLQEKKKLKAEGTKAENVKEVVRGKHKVLPCYDNRELSWLKFNERVLDEASDEDVPLCERLTFVSIFSTNLDEFYRVRVGSIYDQMIISDKKRENKTYMTSSEQLERIFKRTKELLKKKEHIYNDLMKEVKNYGVQIVNFDKLSKEEKDGMENYFKNNVMPLLSPQVIGKKHPFPFLNNQEIYAVALLESKNNDKICIVPCRSSVFNRLVQIVPGSGRYMLIEELILHYMPMIFENYTVKSKSLIRITRNADIDIDEIFADEDISYRESMEEMIRMRTKLCPIRMEYSRVLDEKVIRSLCKELNLKKEQTFHQETPLDFDFVFKIQDMLRNRKELFFKRRIPQVSTAIDKTQPMIDQIEKKDILLSYPFESMTSFINLLKEAAADPNVASIKMTLYRVAKNSQVVEALIDAAENGKEVVVMVELRARFDEQNNIEWSRRMEDAGCRIIYGIDHTKVHSKICLISYKKDNQVKHITQVGTGNYNEKTSKLYTDLSLMTANEDIAKEVAEVFNKICLEQVVEETEHLLVSPKCMQSKIVELIDKEIEKVAEGKEGYIGFKCNSLTDKVIIKKLIEASNKGVKVDMVIRGISCLIAGVPGYTENITIKSIVGRYLEHSRIYIFGKEPLDKIYISSADLMTRNTVRRVEVAAPIYDEAIKKRIRGMFNIMLSDNVKGRRMKPNGKYCKDEITGEAINSQEYFFEEAYGEHKVEKTSKNAGIEEAKDNDVSKANKESQNNDASKANKESKNNEVKENTNEQITAQAKDLAKSIDGKENME